MDELIFCLNRDKVLAVFDMLGDDISKEIYANIILVRMLKAKQNVDLVNVDGKYLQVPCYNKWSESDVFVDCGAYIGDTIEMILNFSKGNVDKIFAFEPDSANFYKLEEKIKALENEGEIESGKIILENAGVGKENSIAQFLPDENSHKLGGTFLTTNDGGKDKVAIYSLDDYFGNRKISAIKADVEGYEYLMLEGAEHILSMNKPRLVICLYHDALDLFRIAIKIKEVCPKYKIIVRQHDYSILDTVLYAYVES